MCGLVGVAGEVFNPQEKVFRQMLIMDALRGEDSTGVAFIGKHALGNTVVKEVGDPFALMTSNRFEKAINKANRVLIGHNRFATQGAVNKRNAHPFEFDSLIGAHNGTLSSKYKLADNLDFKVDSENLYHHIEQRGLQDAINQLGGLNNSYSLVWWDKDVDTLNFLRNKERPMWITSSEDGKCIFWASEPWMLIGALGRNNIKHGDVMSTPEDMLMTFTVAKNGELSKPVLRQVKPAEPIVVVYNHNNNGKPPAIVTPPQPNKADVKQTTPTAPVNVVQNRSVKEEDKAKKPSNVLELPVPNSKGLADSYLGIKQRKFELLTTHLDSSGNEYFALFDRVDQYKDVRLYARNYDRPLLLAALGGDIIGDISGYQPSKELSGRGYYKLNPWNVKIVEEEPRDPVVQVKEVEDEEDTGELYPTATGNFVNLKAWQERHAYCAWCSNIPHPLTAKFSTSGDCVCGECATNPQVLDAVTLVK